MIQTLVNDNRYNGKYIAMKGFRDHTVVGEGSTPKEAYDKALKKGHNDPVIAFVPLKNVVQIYYNGYNKLSVFTILSR